MASIPSQQYTPYIPPGAIPPGTPVTINIYNGKEEKKDDKKDDKKAKVDVPGALTYAAAEMAIIPFSLLTLTSVEGNAIYRPTYLTALVAGSIFGLYKAMTKGRKIGLEKRATAFAEAGWASKAWMLVELSGAGPGALNLATYFQQMNPLGDNLNLEDLVVAGWGFRHGADLSTYAYNNLMSS